MDQNLVSLLGSRVRPVLNLVDDLRKIGMQQRVPIPQIAVMGDQSSGKSSVLEAISGIAFPRGAGLVTRCATQITMSRGDEWNAELRTGDEGEVIFLGPGQESEITEHISKLTEVLIEEAGATFCTEKFIEVKLVSPNAPDLTIIDLPGIVRTATDGQDPEVIGHVNGLLDKYLKQERTIILAVIPSNVDIATVDIIERAQKVDPQGIRTFGVLTKPDLVDEGAENTVIEVLSNRAKKLKHGYVMVKNRSQADAGKTHSASNEQAYFKSSPFWGQGRLGVDELTEALTELLVSQIERALPTMKEQVEVELTKIETELAELPEAPNTPQMCRAACSNIVQDISSALMKITNLADYRGFAPEDTNDLCVLSFELEARKLFAENVRETCPDLRDWALYPVPIGDFAVHQQTNRRCSITEIDGRNYTVQFHDGDEPKSAKYDNSELINETNKERGHVATMIKSHRGRELPGFMSFGAFKQIMSEYTLLWAAPTSAFQKSLEQKLSGAVAKLIHFKTSSYPPVAAHFQSQLREHIRTSFKVATKRITDLQSADQLPMTENHYLWDTISKIRNDRMRAKVTKLPTHMIGGEPYVSQSSVNDMLAAVGNLSNEEQELQDMVDMVDAYWKVAMKRYVDGISMILTDVYTADGGIQALVAKLSSSVLVEMDDAILLRLFEEDAQQARRRAGLVKDCSAMLKAKERLARGV